MTKPPRKIKNILLMPKIQIRYMYYVLALVTMPMSLLLAYTVTQIHKMKLEIMLINQLPSDVLNAIDIFSTQLTMAVLMTLILIVVTVVAGTLMMTHRFVGPIYVINKYIEAMKKGDYSFTRELRKEDEMKDTLALLKELGAQLNKPDEK